MHMAHCRFVVNFEMKTPTRHMLALGVIIFFMMFLKDKLLIFIILTALLQLYIIVTRGDWEIKLEGNHENRLKFSEGLLVESEYTVDEERRTIGIHTYFVNETCVSIDRLTISVAELFKDNVIQCPRVDTRFEYLSQFEETNRDEENLLRGTTITICPDQRIEISNWFKYSDNEASDFKVNYSIGTTGNRTISRQIDLVKKMRLEINGRHHYDFIILLYPVLWIVLGVLVSIQIVRVVVKKITDA
jgi:hypothetical protein